MVIKPEGQKLSGQAWPGRRLRHVRPGTLPGRILRGGRVHDLGQRYREVVLGAARWPARPRRVIVGLPGIWRLPPGLGEGGVQLLGSPACGGCLRGVRLGFPQPGYRLGHGEGRCGGGGQAGDPPVARGEERPEADGRAGLRLRRRPGPAHR